MMRGPFSQLCAPSFPPCCYWTVSVTLVAFTSEPAAPEIEIAYAPAGVSPPPPPPPLPLFPPPQAARNSRPKIIKEASTLPQPFFFLEMNPVPISAALKIGSSNS